MRRATISFLLSPPFSSPWRETVLSLSTDSTGSKAVSGLHSCQRYTGTATPSTLKELRFITKKILLSEIRTRASRSRNLFLSQDQVIVVRLDLILDIMSSTSRSKHLPSRPYSHQARWGTDSWTWEILSCLLSVLAIVAVVILLLLYNGKPLPNVPYHIGVCIFLTQLS